MLWLNSRSGARGFLAGLDDRAVHRAAQRLEPFQACRGEKPPVELKQPAVHQVEDGDPDGFHLAAAEVRDAVGIAREVGG